MRKAQLSMFIKAMQLDIPIYIQCSLFQSFISRLLCKLCNVCVPGHEYQYQYDYSLSLDSVRRLYDIGFFPHRPNILKFEAHQVKIHLVQVSQIYKQCIEILLNTQHL